ncbi:DUF2897 family protein [Shewanella sp.]|uniref:DUF2897 family protein n=1 Tax=Shewanella sp. TaxID=50422 RepID=UPI003A986D29
MSDIEAIIIILLIIGVIFSNLAVLKYSAKFKMPQFGAKDKHGKKPTDNRSPDDDEDDEPPRR